MKDATVTTFKFFWAHQDEEQEKKFERMLVLMLCSALPALVVLITTDKPSLVTRMSMPSLVIISTLYAVFFLFLAYSVLRLLWRIREVRAPRQV